MDKGGKIPVPPQPKGRSFPFHHLIAIALIAGVALVAYSNTFHVPFQFDDRAQYHTKPQCADQGLYLGSVGTDGQKHL